MKILRKFCIKNCKTFLCDWLSSMKGCCIFFIIIWPNSMLNKAKSPHFFSFVLYLFMFTDYCTLYWDIFVTKVKKRKNNKINVMKWTNWIIWKETQLSFNWSLCFLFCWIQKRAHSITMECILMLSLSIGWWIFGILFKCLVLIIDLNWIKWQMNSEIPWHISNCSHDITLILMINKMSEVVAYLYLITCKLTNVRFVVFFSIKIYFLLLLFTWLPIQYFVCVRLELYSKIMLMF